MLERAIRQLSVVGEEDHGALPLQFLPALLLHHILNSLRPEMPQEKEWDITKIVGKSIGSK